MFVFSCSVLAVTGAAGATALLAVASGLAVASLWLTPAGPTAASSGFAGEASGFSFWLQEQSTAMSAKAFTQPMMGYRDVINGFLVAPGIGPDGRDEECG
jgi:hypothetical protein